MALGAPFLVLALRHAARCLPPAPRPQHRWPSGEAAAVLVLPFVLTGLLALVLRAPEGEGAESTDEPDVLLALLASQLVVGSAALLAALLAARRPGGLASLGLARPLPARAPGAILRVYAPGFLCVIGLGLVWTHVCRALGWEERQEILRLILGLERHELVLAAVLAVGAAPLLEELLFRGFLQGFMAQVVGERWAVLCASAVFARLHGVAGLPSLFLLSLFFGWLQVRTRSLWAPVLAHALNNAVMLALPLLLAGKVEGAP
jgi:hypothetical protein